MSRADKLFALLRECAELKDVHERFIVEPTAASEGLTYLDPAALDGDVDAAIARDLAALASSGGGVLMLGVETEADGDEPARPVRLSPLPEGLSGRLEVIASAQVAPPLANVQLHRVPEDEPQFVAIAVPASDDAPHQSLHDFCYWHRPQGVSRQMNDREIRLVMHWAKAPRLKLNLEFDSSQTYRFGPNGVSDPILLGISVFNTGRDVALEPEVILTLPKEPAVVLEGLPTLIDDISESHLNAQVLRFYGGESRRIYPGQGLNLGVLRFRIHGALIQSADADFMIWQIFAREMPRVASGVKAATLFSVQA